MNKLARAIGMIPARVLLLAALATAVTGFVLCFAEAIRSKDENWLARGGAWIASTGALTLFAEWTADRELQNRKKDADAYVKMLQGALGAETKRNVKIAHETLESVSHEYRFPIVSVSAALLFVGTLLHGFGDILMRVLLGWIAK